MDWARIDVLLADERWVSEDDNDSNTRLVRESLLQGPASEARYLSLKQPGDTPADGLAAAETALEELHLPLDVLILGMGNDGHTASLFPDAPELDQALDTDSTAIVAPMTPPSQPQKRITLTLRALSRAGFTALHLKGGRQAGNPAGCLQRYRKHPRNAHPRFPETGAAGLLERLRLFARDLLYRRYV